MFDAQVLPSFPVYGWEDKQKQEFLRAELNDLCHFHAERCEPYRRIYESWSNKEEFPFLPVRLFKQYDLKSVPDEELYRTMTSSGTTGQQVSKIYLDRETSTLQSKILARIVGDLTGKQRLPMIILDTSQVIKNRAMFSARGAGILGFSMFARDKVFALDENMQLNTEELQAFLDRYQGEDILLFGFTFMIWEYFCSALRKSNFHPDLSRGILIHGGGWKKLAGLHISTAQFKQELLETCNLKRVHNYYGMVEQTGTIFMECEHGHLHTPVWADVCIRRAKDFSEAGINELGLIEVQSVLPRSYPGHILLTEDEGRILGLDDCPCGRKGRYFEITGRISKAEIRGCSDTYEQPR